MICADYVMAYTVLLLKSVVRGNLYGASCIWIIAGLHPCVSLVTISVLSATMPVLLLYIGLPTF